MICYRNYFALLYTSALNTSTGLRQGYSTFLTGNVDAQGAETGQIRL
jgi:hypothetical protein